MHDHVAIVEHGPTAAGGVDAVERERTDVLFELELFEQIVFNRLGLTQVVDGCDDKVVGKGGLFMYVQQDDVDGLLVLNLLKDLTRQGDAVQNGSPFSKHCNTFACYSVPRLCKGLAVQPQARSGAP